MKKINLKKLLSILFTICFGLFLGAAGAQKVSSATGYILWHHGFTPIPAYVRGYFLFSDDIKTAIHNSCLTWDNAGAGNLVYRTTTDHEVELWPNEDDNNCITQGNRGSNNYIMATYPTSWKIVAYTLDEGDIDINWDKGISTTYDPNKYDFQSAMTHEIGHLLGLKDLTDTNYATFTMYETMSPGDLSKRTLESGDIDGINYIY